MKTSTLSNTCFVFLSFTDITEIQYNAVAILTQGMRKNSRFHIYLLFLRTVKNNEDQNLTLNINRLRY